MAEVSQSCWPLHPRVPPIRLLNMVKLFLPLPLPYTRTKEGRPLQVLRTVHTLPLKKLCWLGHPFILPTYTGSLVRRHTFILLLVLKVVLGGY